MYEGIDTIVLFEELAYGDALPMRWQPLAASLDPLQVASWMEHNLRLLQACAALEEYGGGTDKPDEVASSYPSELARLDLKINLLLDLVGQLMVEQRPRPPAVALRFNAIGATWRVAGTPPRPRERGTLEIYLRECLAQPLRLIGEIVSIGSDSTVKVRFEYPGEAVADLIEKLAFRRHRRQIAGVRQPRRGAG
jgi:hypothetical protein